MLFWTCNIFPRKIIEVSQDLSWGTRVFFWLMFQAFPWISRSARQVPLPILRGFQRQSGWVDLQSGGQNSWYKDDQMASTNRDLQEAHLSIRFSIQTKDDAYIYILCVCKFLSPLKFLKICLCQIWSTRAEEASVSVCSGTKEWRFEVGMHFIDHTWATWA